MIRIALLFFIIINANGQVIKAVSDIWEPYTINFKTQSGYLIEVLNKISSRENLKVQYKEDTFKNAKNGIIKNKYNLLLGCTHDDSSPFEYIDFPLGKVQFSFYHHKDLKNWKYESIKSFKDLKLGVIKGYGHGKTIDQYINSNPDKIKVYENTLPTEKLITGIQNKEIDVFLYNSSAIEFLLKSKFKDAKNFMVKSQKYGNPTTIYFCHNKQSNFSMIFQENFLRTLDNLDSEGILKKLQEKYSILK